MVQVVPHVRCLQSAPLAEARGDTRRTFRTSYIERVSIRSPCRSKGRLSLESQSEQTFAEFNPLPLPKQGEIVPTPACCTRRFTFQSRSPCRSKGRWMLDPCRAPLWNWFQSAPLAEARGDIQRHPARRSDPAGFNSAPLAEARGDVLDLPAYRDQQQFQSAPLAEARGDSSVQVSTEGRFTSFQSAPLAEARGDLSLSRRATACCQDVSIRSPCRSKGRSETLNFQTRTVSCFNPLPLPKQGGDPLDPDSRSRCSTCFNPLPLPKQGEICLRCSAKPPSYGRFQSAPLAEAKGRYSGAQRPVRPPTMFQSAPLAEARGDESRARPWRGRRGGFNPLPLPKQGEISRERDATSRDRVSIRSPCRSKGRSRGRSRPTAIHLVSIRSPCRSKGRCAGVIE